MKKTTKIGIIILVLLLAIGFASLATNLLINGSGILGYNNSNFDIYFSDAQTEEGGTVSIDQTTRQSINYSTTILKDVGDEAVLDYVVTNNSNQYDAEATIEFEFDDGMDEYITITKTGFVDDIPTLVKAKSSTPGRVKIALKKVYPGTISFDFTLKIHFEPKTKNEIGGDSEDETCITSGYYKLKCSCDNRDIAWLDGPYYDALNNQMDSSRTREINYPPSNTYECYCGSGNNVETGYIYNTGIFEGNICEDGILTLRNMIFRDNTVIEPTDNKPDFSDTSYNNEDEDGLYKFDVLGQGYGGTNNGGTTYYFRGDVENNRVYFAGFHWNIVRINEDGTIRLLAESLIQGSDGILQFDNSYTSINNMYYSNNTNAKSEIDTWYHTYIEEPGYDSYVASGNYFCEQAKVTWNDGSYGTGNASMTYYDSYSPTLECSTDGNGYGLYNGKIALITYDELVLAGAYPGQNNTYYYIHKNANVYSWWTMSPMGMAANTYASAWRIDAYGELEDNATTERLGLVPVINLKANVTATKDPDSGEYIINYQEGE